MKKLHTVLTASMVLFALGTPAQAQLYSSIQIWTLIGESYDIYGSVTGHLCHYRSPSGATTTTSTFLRSTCPRTLIR
ncbi:hypothetical protein [Deinococcus cellulosilyticus]|uniref:Uncharacterized protein n=1 Tax=Deinococcus cellulosilyticus (strain DSM 18568 / NBRC 106333 / KACC 11606 / 5516J-15) TaxID=1223518 RepID=A0A511MVH9_DEIC1|nr:hypothetical protein [Deinococcus cellulosilyticus]GEM44582.1 hypothetical protein DC3_02170 [Deinococcus cellulosilyticus NBRC 106333 = KACC 11606]